MSRFNSAYLSTRLGAFANRLISLDQLKGLIGLDLEQVLSRVSTITGHSYQLGQDQPERIENQLSSYALADFQLLIRPFSSRERRFLNYAIRWFELANLKLLIRGKFSKTDSAIIRQQLIDLGSFAGLPLNRLLNTDDPHEMLRMLETTAYAGIVRQARFVYEEQGNDLFLLDATIDKSFFINLNKRIQALHPEDADSVGRIMGALLDRFNLIWLLRYRFSYSLSAAKSYYLLTATGNRLHSADLMRLARMDDWQQVVDALPEALKRQLSGIQGIPEIESMMEYSTLAVAAKELHQLGSIVARTFCYILLREAEVRFMQALIKGKLLGFDQRLIDQAVVGGQ